MARTLAILVFGGLLATGCTTNPELNRAAIGGAGVGALAAATNNDVGTGVALGVAAGALCDDVVPELCPR